MKVEGGKELANKFKSMGKKIYTEQEQSLLQAGMVVERSAKQKAPVDTGRLRSSIATRLNSSKDTVVVEVGTNVEYAPYVEFGSSRSPAKPFLLPAFTENKAKVLKMVADAMKRGTK
jgi:HK97 gp10 family phage protein